MNAEIGWENNYDINHQARQVVELTREYIKKPFSMDLVPQALRLQARNRPKRGKGTKVTIPTYPTKSLVRL